MPENHAEYSPSSMADKIKCPGRHLATLGLANGSSSHADRGTECHDWAEELLIAELDGINLQVPNFVEDWQEECTRDMVAHVQEMMVLMAEGDENSVDVYTEAEVTLGTYPCDVFDMSQVWGTCDVILVNPETEVLTIIDYKTGIGVPVSPVNNVQLMIYALGAMKYVKVFPKKLNICISQPRIEPQLQVWETTPNVLLDWMTDTLIPKLIAMSKPGAEFVPGESQCRWCPISGKCKAQRDEMLGLFDTSPSDQTGESPTFSDDEVNTLMRRLPEFKQWMNQIEGVAMDILMEGKEMKDFKLVRGKSNRKWIDTDKADTYLRNQKLKEKDRYTYKLLSPAQAEKALKDKLQKKAVRTNFDKLWEKPEGKLSWASIDDKRPGVVIDKKASLVDLNDLL